MFSGGISIKELLVVLAIVLIVFGPRKLPEIGRAMGKSLKEFKQAASEIKESINTDDEKEKDKTN